MSRYKRTVMALVAVVMLLAAGTPARAETVAGKQRVAIGTEVARKQNSGLPIWWRWFGQAALKLKSRYAMAAN